MVYRKDFLEAYMTVAVSSRAACMILVVFSLVCTIAEALELACMIVVVSLWACMIVVSLVVCMPILWIV